MKKTPRRSRNSDSAELLAEYRFDYRKAQPNRFAGRADADKVIVVLDADVSKVFSTPQQVNAALRALIEAMPRARKPRTARG